MFRNADPLERYESKINRTPDMNGCHLWTAPPNSHGYGQIQVGGRDGKRMEAHRFGYIYGSGFDAHGEALGPLLPGICVCHTCDVPACQNQQHWFRGTRSDNMTDCVHKGRHGGGSRPGELAINVKLTGDQVADIRRRYAAGGVTQQVLGDEFGVAQAHISMIVLNKAWAHAI